LDQPRLLFGCHEIEGEGNAKLTECTTLQTVEVRQNPHGRIIAGINKGMNIIVGERRGEWVKIDTDCAESIVPGSAVDWNRTDAYLFYCPENSQ
jgi:hypothetical protein